MESCNNLACVSHCSGMAIFRDGWNAIRHLLVVILDKTEPDKGALCLFSDCGVLAQRRGNVRASAEAA